MGEGRHLAFLSNIERWYLDLVRAAIAVALVIATSAIVVAGIWYATAMLGSPAEHFDDRFETPVWDDIRQGVLPLAGQEDGQPAGREHQQTPDQPGVDPRIAEIADNLNRQFARNPGQQTAFTDAYPRRSLESWIRDRAGVPTEMQEDFIDALRRVSHAIGGDPMINRIGSVPSRAETMQKALVTFRDEYVVRANLARDEVAVANRARASEQAASATNALLLGAGGAALMLSLLLVVVLLRIEVHLRRIGR